MDYKDNGSLDHILGHKRNRSKLTPENKENKENQKRRATLRNDEKTETLVKTDQSKSKMNSYNQTHANTQVNTQMQSTASRNLQFVHGPVQNQTQNQASPQLNCPQPLNVGSLCYTPM